MDVLLRAHHRRLHTCITLRIFILLFALRALFLSMFIDDRRSLPSPPLPQALHFSHSGAACMQHLVSAVAVAPAQHRAQGCKFPTQTQWCNTTDRHRMQITQRKLFVSQPCIFTFFSPQSDPMRLHTGAPYLLVLDLNSIVYLFFVPSRLSAHEKSFPWQLNEATPARSLLLWRTAAGGLCVGV